MTYFRKTFYQVDNALGIAPTNPVFGGRFRFNKTFGEFLSNSYIEPENLVQAIYDDKVDQYTSFKSVSFIFCILALPIFLIIILSSTFKLVKTEFLAMTLFFLAIPTSVWFQKRTCLNATLKLIKHLEISGTITRVYI